MNLKCFRIAKAIYSEIINVDNTQYEKAMYDFYDNKNFVDFTLQSDRQAIRMFKRMHPQAEVKTQTNGNVFFKYIETDQSMIILALLSKTGKLSRQDLRDALTTLNLLLQKLYEGKYLETSCNAQSLRLLNRLKKMDNRVKIRKVHDFGNIMGVGQWSHYRVSI